MLLKLIENNYTKLLLSHPTRLVRVIVLIKGPDRKIETRLVIVGQVPCLCLLLYETNAYKY